MEYDGRRGDSDRTNRNDAFARRGEEAEGRSNEMRELGMGRLLERRHNQMVGIDRIEEAIRHDYKRKEGRGKKCTDKEQKQSRKG